MDARFITRTAVLVAITLTLQAVGLPPQIRGPAFNAMLLLSTIFAGPVAGLIIGVLTPWFALTWEFISPVLAPVVPFLILGNGAFVLAFTYLYRTLGRYAALFTGALAKFLILAAAVRFILQVPQAAAATLGVPELFSALLGGAAALVMAQLVAGFCGEPELFFGKRVGRYEN